MLGLCNSHWTVGSVPSIKTSERTLGQKGLASWPLSAQTSAALIPAMAWNDLTSRYGWSCAARFMNSVQIGNAERAPSNLYSPLSSKPTQTTHSSSLVKPANHPSWEVPVLPAAGSVKPRVRTPAPVPLRQDILHHAYQKVCNPWVEHRASVPPLLAEYRTVGCAYERNRHRADANAMIGECSIGPGDFQRGSFISA